VPDDGGAASAMVVAAAFGIGLEPENFSQRSAAGDCKTIVSHVYM